MVNIRERLQRSFLGLLLTILVLPQPIALAQSGDECPPLPPPAGPVINVSTVSALESAVNSADPGDTILVADGTYPLNGTYLRFDTPNVTLRSASGNREAVVLDGNYLTTEIIQIVASDVTIADLTLREAYHHPIHVMTEDGSHTLNTLIYNVRIIDPREQAIKINPAASGYYPDDGVIACSHIELTDAGRPNVNPTAGGCYTGGIDAHQARGWVIRDNLIEGFWCPSGLSEHGVHMWRGCRDTVVERNLLRDNARGIGFGLETSGEARTYPDNPCPGAGGGYVDHYDGIIRNNFIFASDGGLFASDDGFDSGISLWQACGARVLHNTVASTQNPAGSSIEWRFDHTDVEVVNNLTTYRLWDRGGTAHLAGNLQYQPLSLFVDGSGGDLHLASSATNAIDQVTAPADVAGDIDGQTRPFGSASDVGADEFLPSLTMHGSAADEALHLSWQVNATLPVTSTWRIAYDGPTGDEASPITGIISPTRAYTLTGLTNYTWYTVTLNAMLGSAPWLTDSLQAMPTDIFVYLPLIYK